MFPRFRRVHPLFLPVPPIGVALVGWLVTRSIVPPGFLLSLAATGVILLVIRLGGRIRLEDLGLQRDFLGRGVGVIAMIWGASQVIGVLPRVVANRPVLLDHDFEYGSRREIGRQFLSALGNATLEEIVFRGFLLVQLYLLVNREAGDEAAGIGWATTGTVLVASLAMIPRMLPFASLNIAAIDLAILLLGNLFLCWLYFRSRNLFFLIGVHALLLAPSPVVAGPRGGGAWYQPLVVVVLATVWALLWPRRD